MEISTAAFATRAHPNSRRIPTLETQIAHFIHKTAQMPMALLPTVTLSRVIGSNQMAKRCVLVRKIDVVLTFGGRV